MYSCARVYCTTAASRSLAKVSTGNLCRLSVPGLELNKGVVACLRSLGTGTKTIGSREDLLDKNPSDGGVW